MKRINFILLISCFSLIGIGLIMVYSTSAIFAEERFGDHLHFLKRQLLWVSVGAVVMVVSMSLSHELLPKLGKPLLIATFILLILVLLPGIGRQVGGARRWLRFGSLSFQPSEMAKLALILYTSQFLVRRSKEVKEGPRGFMPLILTSGALAFLILLQPDMGTTLLLGAILLILLFVGGAGVGHLTFMGVLVLPPILFFILKEGYQLNRILIFLNPGRDPSGAGYQITQSFLALGSGGLFGKGLGGGLQKLGYLPAPHTDFIFSIIGEELGFLGTSTIIFLFLLLLWQGMRIVFRSPDPFCQILAVGISSSIALQAAIHIGVTTGTFPTKGITLPFISLGGSSLILNMAEVGLLLNISRKRRANESGNR